MQMPGKEQGLLDAITCHKSPVNVPGARLAALRMSFSETPEWGSGHCGGGAGEDKYMSKEESLCFCVVTSTT